MRRRIENLCYFCPVKARKMHLLYPFEDKKINKIHTWKKSNL